MRMGYGQRCSAIRLREAGDLVGERVTRHDGKIDLVLHPDEIELLRELATQTATVLIASDEAVGANPVRDRLFPRAYDDPTEDTAESEWQSIVHPDLVKGKATALGELLDDLDRVKSGSGGITTVDLSEEQMSTWVSALNDLRISLAVTIDLTEAQQEVPPSHVHAQGFAAYYFLTYLQGELLETLTGPFDF